MKKVGSIIFAFAILSLSHTYGQVLPGLQNRFNTYATGTLQEKLFVHTDKSAYTAGELLWFKIYNVDGLLMRPLDLSKVVYVEVLDDNQNAILQTKIAMRDATGNGSLVIPVTAAAGNYQLRAYTSWMKNFSPDYYFSKQITIINPLKSPEKSKATAAAYDVQFFPEGGNLVSGLSSVIAFKASDDQGKDIYFKGAILNQKNDTVARFSPLKFGIGKFTFKPEANNTYYALITINGKQIRKDLPTINSKGYVMSVKDVGAALQVTVYSNLPAEDVYLFAQTHNVIKQVEAGSTANGTAQFSIDKSKLGEGISQLTIFNEVKTPVCERLYFKRPNKSLIINAATNAQAYNLRKKVEVSLTASNQDNKPVPSDLSISVYRLDSLQHADPDDILSYLWLSSDLKGHVESPGYYFKNTGAAADEAADNLMLTQGWRRFTWADIVSGKTAQFKFLPELNGPLITAKISGLDSKPAGGVIGYLSILGKSVQLYTSKSDSLGRFYFNMRPFYGSAEIVAETNTQVDTNYHIDILSPFSEQYANLTLPKLNINPAMESTFEDQNIAMQVQNVYNSTKLRQFYDPHADSSAFYGTPYKTYLLDNYTRFTIMEEVMREYVREANVMHSHNQFHVRVVNGVVYLADTDPMVLIDGIPFFNMNKLFAVDPLRICKLEDVPNAYSLGASYEKGIFSFTSYKGDLGGAEIDPHAVIIDYEGLQMERQFYSPMYDSPQQAASRQPDFRNTLYWSPSLYTGVSGKNSVSFYTSDQAGKYIGVIQGITPDGEAGSQTFTFEVKADYTAEVK